MWKRTVALASLLLSACGAMPGGKAKIPDGAFLVPATKTSDASKEGCPEKLPAVPWRQELLQSRGSADPTIWVDKECRCAIASFSTWDSAQRVLGEEVTQRLKGIVDTDTSFTNLAGKDRQALKQFSESLLWVPAPIERQVGEQQFKRYRDNIVTSEDDVDQLLPKLREHAEAVAKQYPEIPWDLQFALIDGLSTPGTAMPGGYVVIGRDFMRTAKPDELALVLSHEISHIARRHEAKALQAKIVTSEQTYELFRTIVKGLGRKQQSAADFFKSGKSVKQSISFLGSIGLDYGKNLELEADSCAVPVTMKAGFNPLKGWADYKANFDTSTPSQNSHPPTKEREANLKRIVRSVRNNI